MFGFLWDLHQQQRLTDLQADADRARLDADAVTNQHRDLLRRFERLELVCVAMHSLLQEKLAIPDAEIAERVRQFDLQDGRLDGRYTPTPASCKHCGRPISLHRGHCLYCGR